MRPNAPILLAALLAVALLVPAVQGHAAAPPRAFETRILSDHGDDSAIVLAGADGFDSVALDAREARLPDGRPALVLRLVLNGGCSDGGNDCGDIDLDVEFTGGGAPRTVTFTTPDGGATWTGDAARYVGPEDLNDGTRFAVEGWVPMADVGLAPGVETSDWFVRAADNMPEGIVPDAPDPTATASNVGTYTVGDPDFYVALDADATEAEAEAGDEVRFPVTVTNTLSLEQTVELAALGIDGRFELDGAPVTNVTLAANFTRDVELVVDAPDASAPVAVVATTALGGYATLAFQVTVADADTDTEAGMTMGSGQVMSPDVPVGATWSHTFTQAGTFTYHDHHDPSKTGTLTVEAGDGSATHDVTRTADGFDPAELTITVGDTVTWTNDGAGLLRIMGGYDGVDHAMHVDDGHDDGHDHAHHAGPEGTAAAHEAPGLPVALLGLALVGLALVRRRA